MLPGLDLPLALATVVAIAVVLVPGMAAGAAIGLRGLALFALSGPLSIAVLGAGGVVLAAVGIPFAPWSAALVVLVAAGIAAGAGAAVRIHRRPFGDGPVLASAVAAGAATIVLALFVIAQLPRPDAVSQTYDAVFHLNAAASIVDSGNASSFFLYRLNSPGDDIEFYPAAWHTLVALVSELTGAGIPRATTATWIATSGSVWVLGVVWLTDALFGRRLPRGALAVSSALLAVCFAGFPYILLDFGTLYPTGLAYTLLPAGAALAVVVLQTLTRKALSPEDATADPVLARPWVMAALWLVAGAVSHPRSLFGFAVIVFPLAITAFIRWSAIVARTPRGRRRVAALWVGGIALLVAAVVGAVLFLFRYFGVAERPISDRLNGGPARADQTPLDAIAQVLAQSPPVTPTDVALFPSIGVALLALIGLVGCIRRPERRWIPVAFVAVGVLYVLAASTDSDVAKLATALWYKDKYRLFSLLPVLAVPAAAWAATHGVVLLRRLRVPALRIGATAAGALAIAASLLPTAAGLGPSLANVFAIPAVDKNGKLVDEELWRLLEELPDHVPADERVLGHPWNGSILSWPLGAREPVFPHLVGRWDADRALVQTSLDDILDDPRVCAALDELDAHYLIRDEGLLWNGDPQAERFAAMERVPPEALTVVARSGSATLSRISACG